MSRQDFSRREFLKCALSMGGIVAVIAAVGFARADFTVAEGGVPQADIVIPAKPLDAVRYAADELKYHLDRAFGAAFEIVTEDAYDPSRKPCHFFLGGTKAAEKAGIPGRELRPDERFLKCVGERFYLVGRDSGIKYSSIPSMW